MIDVDLAQLSETSAVGVATEPAAQADITTQPAPGTVGAITELPAAFLAAVELLVNVLPARRVQPLPIADLVAVHGQTLILDWWQAQAFRINCGGLQSRDLLIIDIINIPTGYRIGIPLMLFDVQHYNITVAKMDAPGWISIPSPRKGAQNFYEISTWTGGYKWHARSLGFVDGAG